MPSMLPAVRPGRLRASLDASVAEGAAAEVFGACAGGAVLTGWALFLGASPIVIGLLSALPLAAQIVQLPAAWLTQRIGAKPVTVAAIGAARLVWLPLVAVPFLHLAPATALMVFVAVVALASVLGVIGNNAWTVWMGELVPGPGRGRFLARRMVYLTLAGTISSLAAGYALDALAPRGFKGETLGVLAAVACAAGIVSIRLLLAQQSPRGQEDSAPDWGDVARAVHDPRARPVLGVCSFGISIVPLIWLFVTPDRLWPIAIEAVVSGTLWGGHGIATFDLSIAVSPRRGRPFYLAAFAAAGGLGFAVSSTLAGLLAWALSAPLHALGSSWSEMHVLFLLSAIGRAGAAVLAVRIDEPAARGVPELARALLSILARRSVRLPRAGAAEV